MWSDTRESTRKMNGLEATKDRWTPEIKHPLQCADRSTTMRKFLVLFLVLGLVLLIAMIATPRLHAMIMIGTTLGSMLFGPVCLLLVGSVVGKFLIGRCWHLWPLGSPPQAVSTPPPLKTKEMAPGRSSRPWSSGCASAQHDALSSNMLGKQRNGAR